MAVLIIEDEKFSQRLMKRLFSAYDPIVVPNHDEADNALSNRSDISLIISDNSTALGGGKAGAGLPWVLKTRDIEAHQATPIVLFSSDTPTSDDLAKLHAAGISFVNKENGLEGIKAHLKTTPGFEALGTLVVSTA